MAYLHEIMVSVYNLFNTLTTKQVMLLFLQVNNLMDFIQLHPSDSVLEEYFVPKSIVDKCELFK